MSNEREASRAAEERLHQMFEEIGFFPGLDHFPDAQSARAFLEEQQLGQDTDMALEQDNAVLEERMEAEAFVPEITGAEISAEYQEEVDEAARESALHDNELVNKAYSDVLKVERGLRDRKGGDSIDNRRAMDQTVQAMAEMAEESYQQAYNNTVSFEIGGEDVDFTQGEMNEFANSFADAERERLERLRREGASTEAILQAEQNLRDYERIAELTDPSHGPLTPEEQAEIQSIFEDNEVVAQSFAERRVLRDAANEYGSQMESIQAELDSGAITQAEYDTRLTELNDSTNPDVISEYGRQMQVEAANANRVTRVATAPTPLLDDSTEVAEGQNPLFLAEVSTSPANPLLGEVGIESRADNPLLRTASAASEQDPYVIGGAEKLNPLYNATASGEVVEVAESDIGQESEPDAPIRLPGTSMTT